MALAVLSGTLLALQVYWGAGILVLLLFSLYFRKSPFTTILLVFFFIIFSFFNAHLHQTLQKTILSQQASAHTIQLTIKDIPSIDGNSFISLATIRGEKILARYYFTSEEEKRAFKQLKPGAVCEVEGELTEPPPNKNPNLFNYKKFLYHQGVYWFLDIKEFEGCESKSSWKDILITLRFTGLKNIEESFPPTTVGVTQALLFGETGMIEEDTMKSFRELGVVHLLAISGLHVGMLFAFLHHFLLRAGVTREAASWMGISFLLCYIVLTGGSPSVVRASSMLIVLLLVRKTSLNIRVFDSLTVVFLILVLYEPFSVFNVGFQLSFVVSFSLVISSRTILKDASSLRQMLMVTIVAQLSSLPIVIYHFYEFSLIGFLTNLLYVPLFSTIVLPMAIIMYFLSSIVTAGWVMVPYETLLEGIQWLSSAVSSFPLSTLVMGRPHFLVLLCYLILIYYAFVGFERRKYFSGVLLILLGFLHLLWNNFHPYGEVVFIDVGQGDATLIDLPYNRGTYLIDTGGEIQFPKEKWEEKSSSFSVGEDIVVPFLKSKGITRIDTLILTHGDLDHVGGAEAVLNEVEVTEILISPGSREKVEMEKIVEKAQNKRVSVREAMFPSGWRGDEEGLHIVSPLDEAYEGNNDSIVIYGEIGLRKWLFTGDLEEEGESGLMKTFDLPVDVLKVGHHGSNTSSTEPFLEETNPDVAVISAGETNRFGHPHPDVVERLTTRGMTIYNTAMNGAITYRFWDKRGTFSAQLP
ncbi:DNA internalization-related competence protein ComEC/Rec2 [Rossellomorea sp. YZS02]|uniref:DNA internalization-related competence protein ComEC/Rec2 n=1 Tax=Rossellomorea sp. YZS02 TaxID=3097358 RepID=UPI002A108F61|nr:DNA internalization-related competence protein ComEC/Rec2 [Rossellomorea sp. YZS02]MDX8341908.1 DNA internalization-related competence protein ComEC/Rec2 [Rossellomorea sp. YZS02]